MHKSGINQKADKKRRNPPEDKCAPKSEQEYAGTMAGKVFSKDCCAGHPFGVKVSEKILIIHKNWLQRN